MKANLPFRYITAAKNGKMYVVFDYRDSDNKRKRKWVTTGLPEKCAKKALNDKVEEIVSAFYESYLSGAMNIATAKAEEKKVALSAPVTEAEKLADFLFVDYLKYWYDTAKKTFAYNTVIEYERFCRRISNYYNEHYPNIKLKDVSPLHIQQYYNDLYASGLKGKTVRTYHGFLHSAFKYAVKMNILLVNPTEKAELPRKEKREPTFYTKEELDQLFEAFKGDRLELVVHIASYYGLRRGEILGLKWDSIDFDKKSITIRRKITSSFKNGMGEKIHIDNELKTDASIRTLPLIPHIEKMLKERKELEEYYSKLLGDGFDKEFDGFVCRDNTGNLITPNYTTNHFKRVIAKKGLKKIRFHDLRHSCASLMVVNGIPMKVVQDWLGHAAYTTTANFYSHLEYNSKIASAETIAKLLDNTEETKEENKDTEQQ